MKKLLYLAPIVLGLILGGMFLYVLLSDLDTETIPTPLLNQALPEFSLPTVQDSEQIVTKADLDGEAYILNVWATWCITCRIEHPFLNKLSQEGVMVIGLDYKDTREEALEWLTQFGNPYRLNLFDEEGAFGFNLGVTGAPETYFIRPDGTVAYKHISAINQTNWDEELKAIYDEL